MLIRKIKNLEDQVSGGVQFARDDRIEQLEQNIQECARQLVDAKRAGNFQAKDFYRQRINTLESELQQLRQSAQSPLDMYYF